MIQGTSRSGRHLNCLLHWATMATVVLSMLARTQPASAQTEFDHFDQQVREWNDELGQPALLFFHKPGLRLNNTPARLLGIDNDGLIVEDRGGKVVKVKNKSVKSFLLADNQFVYDPNRESLVQLASRLSQFKQLRNRYGLVANDPAVAKALFNQPPAYADAIAGGALTVPSQSVPLPVYAMERPWEQVALLNPPPPPPKPAPVAPPTLPPAVEPAPAPGGIPEWGKYAIAACGIAAIFVFIKR